MIFSILLLLLFILSELLNDNRSGFLLWLLLLIIRVVVVEEFHFLLNWLELRNRLLGEILIFDLVVITVRIVIIVTFVNLILSLIGLESLRVIIKFVRDLWLLLIVNLMLIDVN